VGDRRDYVVHVPKPRWLHSRWVIALAVVLGLLIALRAALPLVLERYVNKQLDQLKGYSGSVADIDLSLWRGAYQIDGLRVVKTGGKVPIPFVSARQIDLSVQWKALLMKRRKASSASSGKA
jgi:hypothetical protein